MKADIRTIGGACMIFAIAATAAWLHTQSIATRVTQVNDLKTENATLRAQTSQSRKISALRTDLATARNELNTLVPTNDDVADLLQPLATDLDSIGATNRTTITRSTEPGSHLNRIPLTLSFHSSLDGAFACLQRIETYPRIVRPQRVVITRDPQVAPDALVVSMSLFAFARVNGSNDDG